MKHSELVQIGAKWLQRHEQNIIVPNCSTVATEIVSATTSGEVPDVIGWGSGTSVLIEVKTTRNDFKKDQSKVFRAIDNLGMGEHRYYLCPEGLIKKDEVPMNWGLLYYSPKKGITIIEAAERQSASFVNERSILLSLIRRAKRNN